MTNNRIIGLQYIPANQLTANPLNARRHPAKQREGLRGSLDTLGWYDAVIYNERTGFLIDGHARVEEQLTRDDTASIPVLVVNMSEEEEAQAVATHDWIAHLATYDADNLQSLLDEFNSDDDRIQQMLSDMVDELGMFEPVEDPVDEDFDTSDELLAKWGCEAGDVWAIGEHRLYCGDANDMFDHLPSATYRLCFFDPMYNDYDVSLKILQTIQQQPVDGLISLAHGWETAHYVQVLGAWDFEYVLEQQHGLHYQNKPITRHKLACFWRLDFDAVYNYDLQQKTAHKTSMMRFQLREMKDKQDFKYIKPIDEVQTLVMLHSNAGDYVVDPCGGSGTTMIACHNLNNICHMAEIELKTCAIILERMQKLGYEPQRVHTK